MRTEPCASSTALADDILRRDQLDLRLLAAKLGADGVVDCAVDFAEAAGEEAVGHAVALPRLDVGNSGHQSDSCSSLESWSTRRWCRPPAKPVSRNAATQAFAMSVPISRRAQRQHVGVIMLARELGGEGIVHARASALGVAVHRDGNADPRAADGDSALGFPGGHRLCERGTEFRIIDAFRPVRAEVADLVTLLSQPADDLILEEVTGMVGGESDAHSA